MGHNPSRIGERRQSVQENVPQRVFAGYAEILPRDAGIRPLEAGVSAFGKRILAVLYDSRINCRAKGDIV
jgi:hypothetical protein